MRWYESDASLKAVLDAIGGGTFSAGEPGPHRAQVDSLLWGGDHYLLPADYVSYLEAQLQVDALYSRSAA